MSLIGSIGEDDDEREVILNLYTNWITLGMLQYLSCLIAGQFNELVFGKICFDEVVTMSDKRFCWPA